MRRFLVMVMAIGPLMAADYDILIRHARVIDGTGNAWYRGDNFLLDGVPTVITGNCCGSELNLAAWFEKLVKLGLGLNVASFIGHDTVRREVLGTANRLAQPQEIAQMQGLIERAMRERGGQALRHRE